MAELNLKDLRRFEQRLRARRSQLIDILRAELRTSERERFTDIAGEVHDDAGDQSFADLIRDMSLSERERELEELRDVEAALGRIRQGRYGRCIECGADIQRERLEAFPTAKRCIDHQRRHEANRQGGCDLSPSL